MNYQHAPLQDSLFYCNFILPKVSRTFALGIDALKGQLKNSILTGYLLCRIADTIEDDPNFNYEKKILYLNTFLNCFADRTQIHSICDLSNELKSDEAHLDLIKNTNNVFCIFDSLSSNSQAILKHWVTEMVLGMIQFISRHQNKIRIKSIGEYKQYCYYVAGTVGLMLTDLWKEYAIFLGEKKYQLLLKSSKVFGQGLQTINILKDIYWDWKVENSIYVPLEILQNHGCNHDNMYTPHLIKKGELAVKQLISLSHEDLLQSADYVLNIPKFNLRIRFFCILPLLFAFATLKKIKIAASLLSPEGKIKISRAEVKRIYRISIFSCFSNSYLKRNIRLLLN
jgi:farnesyl-diphosphate farnesyltransferase